PGLCAALPSACSRPPPAAYGRLPTPRPSTSSARSTWTWRATWSPAAPRDPDVEGIGLAPHPLRVPSPQGPIPSAPHPLGDPRVGGQRDVPEPVRVDAHRDLRVPAADLAREVEVGHGHARRELPGP